MDFKPAEGILNNLGDNAAICQCRSGSERTPHVSVCDRTSMRLRHRSALRVAGFSSMQPKNPDFN